MNYVYINIELFKKIAPNNLRIDANGSLILTFDLESGSVFGFPMQSRANSLTNQPVLPGSNWCLVSTRTQYKLENIVQVFIVRTLFLNFAVQKKLNV